MADAHPKVASSVGTGSGRTLALYAIYAIVGFALLVVLLGLTLEDQEEGGSVSGEAVDAASNTIRLVLGSEPPQMDTTRATDSVSLMVLGHVMEGLLRYDAKNDLIPGVAERWEIDGVHATFYLRKNAMWSNGTPVTAHDFVFSWRKALDPENASQYAFIMYPVKNAVAVNEGTLPLEALGVVAVDDHTLRIELERPASHFDKLVVFGTFFPINEAFYESMDGAYGSEAENLLYNGPFVMSRWKHDASVRLDKNELYWNKDAVRLQTIDYAYILGNANAVLKLFESGDVVMAGLLAESLEPALENRWVIKQHNDGSVWFMEINFREGRLTRNYNLRKALQLATDPEELVYKVIKLPGNRPTTSIFPTWLRGVNGYFRDEYPAPIHVPNEKLAREHLQLALDELGLDELPPLVMLTGDTESANKQSEYFQNVFNKKLGIQVRIDRQIFKLRLQKMTAGEFDMVMAGWGPDYNDPLTFGDLFASWNENNRGRYASEELDKWVEVAQSSPDQRVRMEAFDMIQKIMYDDVAVIMHFERGSQYVIDDRVKGVVRRSVGTDPDFSFAYIDEGS